MKNQYAASCYKCGSIVRKNEGVFQIVTDESGTKWRLLHVSCDKENKNEQRKKEAEAKDTRRSDLVS